MLCVSTSLLLVFLLLCYSTHISDDYTHSARIALESLLPFVRSRVQTFFDSFACSLCHIHPAIIHRIVRGRLPANSAEPSIVRASSGLETFEMHLGGALAVTAVAQEDAIARILSVPLTDVTNLLPFDRR